VYCTGHSQFGQCADSSTAPSFRWISSLPTAETIVAIHAAKFASYAISSDGTVRAWGLNIGAFRYFYHSYLPLGDPLGADSIYSTPTVVPWFTNNREWAGKVTEMCSGEFLTSALLDTGRVVTWGLNIGESPCVGNNSAPSGGVVYDPYLLNTTAFAVGEKVSLMSCGINYGIAWTNQQQLYTWGGGLNSYINFGGIPLSTAWASRAPINPNWPDNNFVVSVGGNVETLFVLTNTSKLNSTGYTGNGDFGYDDWSYSSGAAPTRTLPPQYMNWVGTSYPIQLVTADVYTLILLANGQVWAAGTNYFGSLGTDGPTYSALVHDKPVLVPISASVVDVASTLTSTIALLANGSIASTGTRQGNLGCSSSGCPIALPYYARVSPFFHSVAGAFTNATRVFGGRVGAFIERNNSFYGFADQGPTSHDWYLGRSLAGEVSFTPGLDLVLNGSLLDLRLNEGCGFAITAAHELKAFGWAGCVASNTDPITIATNVKFIGVAQIHLIYSDGQSFWEYRLGQAYSSISTLSAPDPITAGTDTMKYMAVGKQVGYHVIAAFKSISSEAWSVWGYGDNSHLQAIGNPINFDPMYADSGRNWVDPWLPISLPLGMGDIVQLEAGAYVRFTLPMLR
jgi:alpha-tubulin suppressor-like RCC1 family protein